MKWVTVTCGDRLVHETVIGSIDQLDIVKAYVASKHIVCDDGMKYKVEM